MEDQLGNIISYLRNLHPAAAAASLFGLCLVEYVFPPVPSDAFALAAAVVYAHSPLPLAAGFAGACLGSTAGAMLVLLLGIGAKRIYSKARPVPAWLKTGFAKFGPPLLLFNRFFPGVRPLFFVAAGLTDIPRGRVLLFAALGAVLWNLCLFGAGLWMGH